MGALEDKVVLVVVVVVRHSVVRKRGGLGSRGKDLMEELCSWLSHL